VPYRDARVDAPKRTPEPGIVADMVRQFADRYAFLRELVQNAIDAGASRISVRVELAPGDLAVTSVEDDGCGMTRETIEGPLLTIFSSSKESCEGKIGKYGVGFVSVLAVEPERVEVTTWRDGRTWRVTLLGDHSYELAAGDARKGSGTDVSLVHAMSYEAFLEHAAHVRAALARWCRHARVPIALRVVGEGGARGEEPVNEPFDLSGLVVARAEHDGERFVVALGGEDGQGGGYYNRGLLLFETHVAATDALAGVRFKIARPKLPHTLRRDSVKRDGHLARAHARVEELVRRELRAALYARVAEAADRDGEDPAVLAALVGATQVPGLGDVDPRALILPLAAPIDGSSAMSLETIVAWSVREVLFADRATPLVRALATVGRPVVRYGALAPALRSVVGHARAVAAADGCFTHLSATPGDDALCAEVAAVLTHAGWRAARARIAAFTGARPEAPFRTVETAEPEAVVAIDDEDAWGSDATVFLNAADAGVRLARRRARDDPKTAAHLLCRTILLTEGPIPARTVDRLLRKAALERSAPASDPDEADA
jgi:molecular chaperone HtpG